jgi:prevent-host-death family protein
MKVTTLADTKAHLSTFIDEVARTHERVTITRNGIPTAVLIAVDDLEGLEETLAWLSDPARAAEVQAADEAEDYTSGDEMAALMAERAKRSR